MAIGYVYTNPENEINGVLNKLVDQINKSIAEVPTSTPGGQDTQVQYNHAGSFGGIPGMVWSGTDLSLPVLTASGVTFSNGTSQKFAVRMDSATPFVTSAGFQALPSVTGVQDTAFGYQAGSTLSTGTASTFLGYQVGKVSTTASNNTGVGSLALTKLTAQANTTAVGASSLSNVTSGAGNNAALGYATLFGASTASQCTALGYGAGYFSGAAIAGQSATNAVTTALYSTFIGFQACPSSTTARNYQTVIGAGAVGYDAANTVTLGLVGTDTPYMGPAVIGMATVTTYYTIGTLPTPTAALKGARAFVTDGLVATGFGNAVAGTGAVLLPVICDGVSAWLYG